VPQNAFLPVLPVVTVAMCGRAFSWRRQTLLTDRPRRFEGNAGLALLGLQEASINELF
jgi:hypothetical protein